MEELPQHPEEKGKKGAITPYNYADAVTHEY
jgi:hypothetical protein